MSDVATAAHSANYAKIKRYYDAGIWTKNVLRTVVGLKNGITAAEYQKITGEPYVR